MSASREPVRKDVPGKTQHSYLLLDRPENCDMLWEPEVLGLFPGDAQVKPDLAQKMLGQVITKQAHSLI